MKKFLLALSLILAFSLTAYAETLDSVSLTFDGDAPIEGDTVENNFDVFAGAGVEVVEASYTVEEDEKWAAGQKPTIHLELQTTGGCEFKSKSKSYFEIEGMSAKFSKATGDLKDDPTYLEVWVTLPAVKKKTTFELDPPDEFGWDNYTATWDEVDDATTYEVRLLCDDKTVTTVTTSNLSYGFAGNMSKEGFYSFRMRCVHGTKKGEWSSDSEQIYVKPGEAYNNESTSPSNGSPSSSGSTVGAYSNYWKADANGVWHVYKKNGELVTNCWLCDDAAAGNGQNVWYLIDGSGNMISAGLVRDAAGNYYSLETEHNGHYGMMRYASGTYGTAGGSIALTLETQHNGRFGAINNQDAITRLSQNYGVTDISAISTNLVYTSKF